LENIFLFEMSVAQKYLTAAVAATVAVLSLK